MKKLSIPVGDGIEIIINRENGLEMGVKAKENYIPIYVKKEYELDDGLKLIKTDTDLIIETNNKRYSLI